jgi:NAD(P)-dependent dehydrogenase (short-subunit alcohol dehydrogenase family)
MSKQATQEDTVAIRVPRVVDTSVDTTPVWFITGGSSGFGAATVRAALARGYRVAATSRDARTLRAAEQGDARLLALDLDLRDHASITDAVEQAHHAFGRIDVLFNNAGTATVGAIEELTDELLRDQLEVNLLGPLAVTRAVLPQMRQRRRGRILQMSSMGGRCAFPGLGAYHASKFALEGASIALAQEVAPFGVRVTLIEPGDFRTPVLSAARLTFSPPMSEYDETVGRARAGIADLDGTQPGDPDRLADAVIAVAETADPPQQLALGPDSYHRLAGQLAQQAAELREWAHLSLSTDFADVNARAPG